MYIFILRNGKKNTYAIFKEMPFTNLESKLKKSFILVTLHIEFFS